MSRVYKVLYLLRRVFGAVKCVLAKKVIYFSLVRSQLLYCSPVWRPYLLKDIKPLEVVQRRVTLKSSDYRERLINLNILPLMMQLTSYSSSNASKNRLGPSIYQIMLCSVLVILVHLPTSSLDIHCPSLIELTISSLTGYLDSGILFLLLILTYLFPHSSLNSTASPGVIKF